MQTCHSNLLLTYLVIDIIPCTGLEDLEEFVDLWDFLKDWKIPLLRFVEAIRAPPFVNHGLMVFLVHPYVGGF